MMDKLEKVEKLRERANVTYEEARDALERTDWDLLDAIVILEKMGKTKMPERSTFSTSYDEQKEYEKVQEKVEQQKESAPTFGRVIKRAFKKLLRFARRTRLRVVREGKTIFILPTLLFIVVLLASWHVMIPILIIALFFGVRYSFEGDSQEAGTANDILDKAGSFAAGVRSTLDKEIREQNRRAEEAREMNAEKKFYEDKDM